MVGFGCKESWLFQTLWFDYCTDVHSETLLGRFSVLSADFYHRWTPVEVEKQEKQEAREVKFKCHNTVYASVLFSFSF